MKHSALLTSALILAGGMCLCAADPYAGYIYPAGIQAGTTNRLIIGGQNLYAVRDVYFSNPGVKVLNIEKVPAFAPPTGAQRKHLKNWLDGIAAGRIDEPPKPKDPHINEWRSNVWWQALNTLDAGKLAIVEHYLNTPLNSLQASPSLRQMVLVTVTAQADSKPGWGSFSVWGGNGMSAPRPFEVSALPRAAEPLYVPPHRAQPAPATVNLDGEGYMLDGQIMPGSTDTFLLNLKGGQPYSFAVTARELQPYIGDAVPGFFNPIITLKNMDGEKVAVADDAARFRPDPTMSFTPERDGCYRLDIHDVLYRGRADFIYAIAVAASDRHSATASPNATELAPVPDGVVATPGGTSSKTFTVDSPGPRILEVTARRRGSPLDAVLTLRKSPGGPILAQWDDVTNTVFCGTIPQSECDPIGRYDFHEAGTYVAEITDRTGHGGDDYAWWLEVRRPTPGFAVYSTRSTLPLRGGAPLKVGFRILRRDGFDGAVAIEFPRGIHARNAVATSGVDAVTADVFFTGRRPEPVQPLELSATASIGGRTVRMPVVPCDEYEQAFAWRHLVPARNFLYRGVPGGKPGTGRKPSGVRRR